MQIASRLHWSPDKTSRFIELIQEHRLTSSAAVMGRHRGSPEKFSELEMDKFEFIADIMHVAALTLVQSRDGLDILKVASELEVPKSEAEMVVGRLLRMGLVRFDKNKLVNTKKSLEIKEVSSSAIRSLHRQAIRKAEVSIEEQSLPERNLAALTVSLDPEQMAEAKAFINRFLKSFEKKFGHAKSGTIYQLNTQLFRLIGAKR
jgi:uncharacterized protein (TIGR02147 family)